MQPWYTFININDFNCKFNTHKFLDQGCNMKTKKKQTGGQNIGKRLMISLTADQLEAFLEAVFATRNVLEDNALLSRLEPDAAETIKRLAAVVTKDKPKNKKETATADQMISKKKLIENWEELWMEWNDCVGEVGDEEGKYAYQDAHWEPPCFDGDSLATDLEEIAKKMLPLIDDVFELIDQPDLYTTALDEIDSGIRLYPEWMGAEDGDPCNLEENTTHCVLKWCWLDSRKKDTPGKHFINEVRKLEKEVELAALDSDALASFFTILEVPVKREIYELFKNGTAGQWWEGVLENVYSPWHRINHHLQKELAPDAYLEECRKYLAENWEYGKPLINDAIQKENFPEAETYLEKTFSAYLKKEGDNPWYPEISLFCEDKYMYMRPQSQEIIGNLFEYWSEVSLKLGNSIRYAAVRLQLVTWQTPAKWDRVTAQYNKLKSMDKTTTPTLDKLFTQWKNRMARQSIYYPGTREKEDTWIHWLIDTLVSPGCDKKWFLEKVSDWIGYLQENGNAVIDFQYLLVCFTGDLPQRMQIEEKYPLLTALY
jgi:hypothetical protein